MGETTEGALDLLHVPFADIATALGVGYDTVKGWSSGRADPTAENRKALASFMRGHAAELLKMADELDGRSA